MGIYYSSQLCANERSVRKDKLRDIDKNIFAPVLRMNGNRKDAKRLNQPVTLTIIKLSIRICGGCPIKNNPPKKILTNSGMDTSLLVLTTGSLSYS